MPEADLSMPIVGVTEAKAHFSELTREVNATGRAVTVFKNNRPWVVISPAREDFRAKSVETSIVMDEADRKMGTSEGAWFTDVDDFFDSLDI